MSVKTAKDLANEKKIAFNQIDLVKSRQIINNKSEINNKKFVRYTHYLNFSQEQRKDTELAEKVKEDYIEYYNNCKVKIDQIYTAISVYKHLKVEHDRLLKRENVSDNLKEVSRNNLKDLENKIFELGVEKELFGKCLETPDMKQPLMDVLSKDIFDHYNKTAEKYNVTTSITLDTAKEIAGKYSPNNYVQDYSLSRDALNALQAFKGVDPVFYERAPVNKNDYPYDDKLGFTYHELVDGKFVEKPAPSGFFAKFVHYVNKWFGSEYRNEKKFIESEQKALNEASDYAKGATDLVGEQYEIALPEEVKEESVETNVLQEEIVTTLDNEKKAEEELIGKETTEVKEEQSVQKDAEGPDLNQAE